MPHRKFGLVAQLPPPPSSSSAPLTHTTRNLLRLRQPTADDSLATVVARPGLRQGRRAARPATSYEILCMAFGKWLENSSEEERPRQGTRTS